jgi:release factor glutamine methyltransferase
MTVRSLLARGYDTLFFAEVDTPFLDAVLLLAHAMDITKERLLASLPEAVADAVDERFRALLDRRCAGVPVSYIRRAKEFYGLEFYVDERVLVPRPETETLVESALDLLKADPRLHCVHDACAGSGCVGIALADARPDLAVSASDLSSDAAEVLRLNSERILGRTLPFFISDLLDAVPGPFDLIVSNPPYIRDEEVSAMKRIGWPEPEMALRGGGDGTAVAAKLIRSAPSRLAENGWLALEAAPSQFNKLFALMDQAGFRSLAVEKDLAGRDRVIMGRWRDPGEAG